MTDANGWWLLVFEDTDRPNEMFTEKEAAYSAYRHANCAWACHLFERIEVPQYRERADDE